MVIAIIAIAIAVAIAVDITIAAHGRSIAQPQALHGGTILDGHRNAVPQREGGPGLPPLVGFPGLLPYQIRPHRGKYIQVIQVLGGAPYPALHDLHGGSGSGSIQVVVVQDRAVITGTSSCGGCAAFIVLPDKLLFVCFEQRAAVIPIAITIALPIAITITIALPILPPPIGGQLQFLLRGVVERMVRHRKQPHVVLGRGQRSDPAHAVLVDDASQQQG
mmetsp:Transcript_28303/g.60867  ORF Transcript_28303/g.60867 Transcript_28303/m.60867 type:complete len:219 (-) Transcript_28303:1114-1770(-)